ncbi:TlpA family protein disulfide reductase [Flavobacterium suncheonense]|uniref:TlpA family protein disulfide reductase n=1 Tax=Flavobacterium suncheonense TaxID=350894 RepID=UPI000687CEAA|nr:TlpA disulfide reductase family protein [Flavobacterium suncheonense]
MTKKNWMIAILLTIIANSSNLYAQNGQVKTVKQVKSSEIATSNDLNSDKKILSNSTTQTSIDTKINNENSMSFTANIINGTSNEVVISSHGRPIVTINGNNGVFKEKFNIEEGIYQLQIGEEYTELYLKNGLDLKLSLDANKFDESIKYEGSGSVENNFLAKEALLDHKVDYGGLFESNESDFDIKSAEILKNKLARLNDKSLPESFVSLMKKETDMRFMQMKMVYNSRQEEKKINNLMKNTMSPSFDYVNYKGGKSKLEDFRGKYVYIDLWATWCAPCRAEIPFLEKIENKYHGKNIEFVSISLDRQADIEKWKKMITDKKMGGVQLLADNDFNSKFVRDFNVMGIPRFILIDPNGKIVNANAPRPSSPELTTILDELLK